MIFPLEVKCELDTSPIRPISKEKLKETLETVLADDTRLSLRGKLTNRALVEKIGEPPRVRLGVALYNDTARIQGFLFKRNSYVSRLQRVYVSSF